MPVEVFEVTIDDLIKSFRIWDERCSNLKEDDMVSRDNPDHPVISGNFHADILREMGCAR